MTNNSKARPAHRDAGATPVNGGPDKKDIVAEKGKAEAQQLRNNAAGSGERVKETAKEKTAEVKNEAVNQAQDLLGRLKDDLQGYVGPQQERVATTARSISDEVSALSNGKKPETQYVAGLLGNVAGPVEALASSLENKEPKELLGDARRFAARRPGTFLAVAAGIGLLAGRATRSVKDSDEVASSRQDVKEYFGMEQPEERMMPAGTSAQTYTPSPATGTSGDTYAVDEPADPSRTYTDRVPGTVYPDQKGNRR
ncbi:hypothetical protein GCM10009859_00100 [Kocuria salsicia]|uniref:hypothetical protein n=1 Tax=Kocuria salsicia TaxID=664639 RepID=UPI0031D39546